MSNIQQKNLPEFNKDFFSSDYQISYIGTGSIGGKAQGLTFINNTLKSEINMEEFPYFQIGIPKMIVICTDIFDNYMKDNDLFEIAFSEATDAEIAKAFLNSVFSKEVLKNFHEIISEFHNPLTIRSSSILEDNMYEPFAGIYATKMLANSQSNETCFKNLENAVKYIYASTYFKAAKDYIKITKHKTKDEKMAVIIQEVIGCTHEDSFYPDVSGIARSYNYYSMGKLKPENGIVNLCLGLGKTIIDGGITWAYSPDFPKFNPQFDSLSEMVEQTQDNFWVINLNDPQISNSSSETEFLVQKSILDAEKDGSLEFIASTYNAASEKLTIGLSDKGKRVITFAPVLEQEKIPVNRLIKKLLKICEDAINRPVEIEFAASFIKKEDSDEKCQCKFGFLQVRPMAVTSKVVRVKLNQLTGENVFTASENVLGNGTIDSIMDIVYINPETFNLKFTRQMANEVESINNKLVKAKTPYLLIGFGRWGTSDVSVGIPAVWGQVTGAKAIIEATLENVNIEMSQSSHFFQNLTSFKVFYFSIPFAGNYSIDWDWLAEQTLVEETRFLNHVRFEKPLFIKVDGRTSKGVIFKSKSG